MREKILDRAREVAKNILDKARQAADDVAAKLDETDEINEALTEAKKIVAEATEEAKETIAGKAKQVNDNNELEFHRAMNALAGLELDGFAVIRDEVKNAGGNAKPPVAEPKKEQPKREEPKPSNPLMTCMADLMEDGDQEEKEDEVVDARPGRPLPLERDEDKVDAPPGYKFRGFKQDGRPFFFLASPPDGTLPIEYDGPWPLNGKATVHRNTQVASPVETSPPVTPLVPQRRTARRNTVKRMIKVGMMIYRGAENLDGSPKEPCFLSAQYYARSDYPVRLSVPGEKDKPDWLNIPEVELSGDRSEAWTDDDGVTIRILIKSENAVLVLANKELVGQ